jgi:hypothetical protein
MFFENHVLTFLSQDTKKYVCWDEAELLSAAIFVSLPLPQMPASLKLYFISLMIIPYFFNPYQTNAC